MIQITFLQKLTASTFIAAPTSTIVAVDTAEKIQSAMNISDPNIIVGGAALLGVASLAGTLLVIEKFIARTFVTKDDLEKKITTTGDEHYVSKSSLQEEIRKSVQPSFEAIASAQASTNERLAMVEEKHARGMERMAGAIEKMNDTLHHFQLEVAASGILKKSS